MKAPSENYDTKGQLAHVEREQVDIRADIKIIQHDITAIKENMATKTDFVFLNAEIRVLDTKLNHLEGKLEDGLSSIKKLLNRVFIAIGMLALALIPIVYDVLKTLIQK
jgi:cob(I)alamin adenosyltransferase